MSKISLFDTDTVSSNENAFVPLCAGKNNYDIASAAASSKDGVFSGITVHFVKTDTKARHTHFYAIAAPGDRGRIAKGDLKALWEACKLSGGADLDRLPNFAGKNVDINAVHTTPNEQGIFFANIRGTWPGGGAPATGTAPVKEYKINPPTVPAAAPDDDQIDMSPSEPAAEAPAASEDAPPAAATPAGEAKPKASWKDRMKK
jgi:hypothetical protein